MSRDNTDYGDHATAGSRPILPENERFNFKIMTCEVYKYGGDKAVASIGLEVIDGKHEGGKAKASLFLNGEQSDENAMSKFLFFAGVRDAVNTMLPEDALYTDDRVLQYINTSVLELINISGTVQHEVREDKEDSSKVYTNAVILDWYHPEVAGVGASNNGSGSSGM
jgi:hypothetical protein